MILYLLMVVPRLHSAGRALAEMAGAWLALLLLGAGVLFAAQRGVQLLQCLKRRMTDADGTLPLPSFERRRRREARFRLRPTRRQLTRAEGRGLETLHHAIDYLIQSHDLDELRGENPMPRPPELLAVELLLQGRAVLLEGRPPLPSFVYLLKRRAAYLLIPQRHWT